MFFLIDEQYSTCLVIWPRCNVFRAYTMQCLFRYDEFEVKPSSQTKPRVQEHQSFYNHLIAKVHICLYLSMAQEKTNKNH